MNKSKRLRGRPKGSHTVMDEKCIDTILRAIRCGLRPERAAQVAGISASTMRGYKARNPNFETEIEQAEASAELSYLFSIHQKSKDQWPAAAWVLEHRFKKQWAKDQEISVSIKNEDEGPPVPALNKDLAADILSLAEIAKKIITKSDD